MDAREEHETDLIEVLEVSGEVEEVEIGKRAGDDLVSKALTEKMVILMQKISEYGYLSVREIELIYANQTYAYKVLAILKEQGLVQEFKTGLKPRKAFYLRPKGYRTLAKHGKLRMKRRFLVQRFRPFIFNHRMASARAGLLLERSPLVRGFLPEGLLWERRKNDHDKLCDGEFWYQAPKPGKPARVGLEVELNLKSRGRLTESLRDLSNRRDLDHVWWLCGDETIRRALVGLIRELSWIEPQRHFLCGFEDLSKLGHKLELMDSKGALYALDPEKPTLPGRAEALPAPKPKPVSVEPAKVPQSPEPAALRTTEPVGIRTRLREALLELDWDLLRTTVKAFAILGAAAVAIPAISFLWWIEWGDGAEKPKPSKPAAPWVRREIVNRDEIADARGPWALSHVALRSRGNSHGLYLRLTNSLNHWCGLMTASIFDGDGRVLRSVRSGEWIWPNKSWDGGLSFSAPPAATRFVLEIVSDGWECSRMEVPIEVR